MQANTHIIKPVRESVKSPLIMNVYIDNLNLTAKQVEALRVAIKARYTPARVKALNAKIRAAEGK